MFCSFTPCTNCTVTARGIDCSDSNWDLDWFFRVPIDLFKFRLRFWLTDQGIIACLRNSRDRKELEFDQFCILVCYNQTIRASKHDSNSDKLSTQVFAFSFPKRTQEWHSDPSRIHTWQATAYHRRRFSARDSWCVQPSLTEVAANNFGTSSDSLVAP